MRIADPPAYAMHSGGHASTPDPICQPSTPQPAGKGLPALPQTCFSSQSGMIKQILRRVGKIRRSPIRAGLHQQRSGKAGGQAQAPGARRPAGPNPTWRIFDNHAKPWVNAKALRSCQKQIGKRLLTFDLAACHTGVKRLRRQRKLPEIAVELDPVGAGGDRELKPPSPAFRDEFTHSGIGLEPAANDFEIDRIGPGLVAFDIEPDPVFFSHTAKVPVFAGAHERQKILRLDLFPVCFLEHSARGLANKWLRIAEHSIHIEDDSAQRMCHVGSFHANWIVSSSGLPGFLYTTKSPRTSAKRHVSRVSVTRERTCYLHSSHDIRIWSFLPAGRSSELHGGNVKEDRPYNIILLMTDQHRADYAGFLPNSKCPTPNIDRIAGSVAFSNCVTVNPICTPARTALLTGKYTHQIGTLAMSGDLSREHPTYLQALQAAGYWTAGVGKFHWMQGWPWETKRGKGHDLVELRSETMKYGLDYMWEVAGKQLAVRNHCDYCAYLKQKGLLEAYRDHVASRGPNSMDPGQTKWVGKPWPFDENDYVDIVTGREIARALDSRPPDRPFFLFGSFCGPHKPYDPPASYLDAVPLDKTDDFIPGDKPMSSELKERLFGVRRAYKAMIAVIDEQVGMILDKLDREGLLESTVIMFTSDHGEMLGDRNRMSKMQPWRQSIIVPTAIRHPGHIAGRTSSAPIEITDLTATILDIAGLDPGRALSKPWPAFHDRVPCRSLMPIVRGEAEGIRDVAFSECMGIWQMVQTERWKYIRYLNQTPDGDIGERLHDLSSDPCELENRIAEPACSAILGQLREQLRRLVDATPPAQTGWAPFMAQG